MKTEELDDLIQDHLDGALDAAREAALVARLSEAEAGERLEEFVWLHHHLGEALDPKPAPPIAERVVREVEARQGERLRDQVLDRLNAGLLRVRRRAPAYRVWLAWGGLAAAFVLALTALLLNEEPPAEPMVAVPAPPAEKPLDIAPPAPPAPPAPEPEPAPAPAPPRIEEPPPPALPKTPRPAPARAIAGRLEEIRGEVYVTTDKGRERAAAGRELLPNQGLETETGQAVVRLEDSGILEVEPGTVLRRLPGPNRRDLTLARGTLKARSVERTLVVSTPQARAVLSSAQCVISTDPETTRVRVEQGAMRFTRTADGASVDLAAGFGTVAGEQVFLGAVALTDVRAAAERLRSGIQELQVERAREAARQLASANKSEAVEALLSGLESCAKSAQALADDQRKTFDEMRRLQPNPNVPVKGESRVILDELSDKYYDLSRKLIVLADIRRAIQDSFAAVGADVLVKELADGLAGKGDPNPRAAAAEALGRVKRPEAGAALVQRLKAEKEPVVRLALLDALAARGEGSAEALEAEAAQLADGFPQIVIAAARALQASKSPDAIPPLLKALEKAEMRVKEEINLALVGLTGVDKHGDPGAWAHWWKANEEAVRARTYRAPKGEQAGGNQVVGGTTFYGIPLKSDRIVFVIDYSNSMHRPAKWVPPSKDVATLGGAARDLAASIRLPDNPTKVDVARFELKKALATLPDGVKFNIVFFNHTVWPFSPRRMEVLGRDTRQRAFEFIDQTGLILGTDIYEALKAAFGYAGVTGGGLTLTKSDVDTIVFLSDGLPWLRPDVRDKGVADPEKILREVREWNKRPKVVIHTIQISADTGGEKKPGGKGQAFMQRLAEENGGTYVGR